MNMPIQTKTNSFTDIAYALKQLEGIVSVQDIVDCILRIVDFQSKSLPGVDTSLKTHDSTIISEPLKNLYVDLDYQRILRLQHLINKIINAKKFCIPSAGYADIAIRPDFGYGEKKFVWDGLRRCVMAGLCGWTDIQVSIFRHPQDIESDLACQIKEAEFFERRNMQEKMKPEEIWKARVVQEEPDALHLLKLFMQCKIDCLGLIKRKLPNDTSIKNLVNGFALIETKYVEEKIIGPDYWMKASKLIRQTFPSEVNISSVVFCAISHLLHRNDNPSAQSAGYFTFSEIELAFRKYAGEQIEDKKNGQISTLPIKNTRAPLQKDLKMGLEVPGRKVESIAYFITKVILNAQDTLGKDLFLDDSQIRMIEEGLEI